MGYILFLSKHHDGFCLWDTKNTEKGVTNRPLGIDVLARLRKSCDKYGIKLALYYSWITSGPSNTETFSRLTLARTTKANSVKSTLKPSEE